MQFDFIKCHGSGNVFPMIDAREIALDRESWSRVAVALADRKGTVGGDGLLLLKAGDDQHDFGFAMYNSDGSEAETCLNGLRCVARAGFAALGIERATVRLATSTATVAIDPELAPGVVTIREVAGPVDLDVAHWPMPGRSGRIVEGPIAELDSPRIFTAVAIPNPHLIAFVDMVDDAELVALGALCEAAPEWLPNRANVSFVEQRGPSALFVRTCERGVGLTDSCGSAMAASSYAACLTGRCAFGTEIAVFNRGGLVRAIVGGDGMVQLSGNATFEWSGSVTVDLAARTAGPVTVTARYPDEIVAWQGVISRVG